VVRHPNLARLLSGLGRSAFGLTMRAYRAGLIGRRGALIGTQVAHQLSRMGLQVALDHRPLARPPRAGPGTERGSTAGPAELPVLVHILEHALHVLSILPRIMRSRRFGTALLIRLAVAGLGDVGFAMLRHEHIA
jgi:hypothetical protein